jgi:hypothetical protein
MIWALFLASPWCPWHRFPRCYRMCYALASWSETCILSAKSLLYAVGLGTFGNPWDTWYIHLWDWDLRTVLKFSSVGSTVPNYDNPSPWLLSSTWPSHHCICIDYMLLNLHYSDLMWQFQPYYTVHNKTRSNWVHLIHHKWTWIPMCGVLDNILWMDMELKGCFYCDFMTISRCQRRIISRIMRLKCSIMVVALLIICG